MQVDYSTLDVIVLTYNRANNLRVMLESLCTQTVSGFGITVLNNASTDNTLDVIAEVQRRYPKRNIDIITNSRNIGNVGNFKKSQRIAKNKYTAIFHDDDAIHPEYIETAMKLLMQNEDAVLCSGNVVPYYNVDNHNWSALNRAYYIYPQEMGTYLQLQLARQVFQTAIYKTDAYKSVPYRVNMYGKLHDIIFLAEMSQKGDSILILGECGRMGCSPSQDSCNLRTGPFPDEIANIIVRLSQLSENWPYAKPALWNFAYFLYLWADLAQHEEWEQFTDRIGGAFTSKEKNEFSLKCDMDEINEKMRIHAQKLCQTEGIFHDASEMKRSGIMR